MRGVFEGKEVEDNYCAWRCSLENGDRQDSFGGALSVLRLGSGRCQAHTETPEAL